MKGGSTDTEVFEQWMRYHTSEKARAELPEPLQLAWQYAIEKGINSENARPSCVNPKQVETIRRQSKRLCVYANSIRNSIAKRQHKAFCSCGLLFNHSGVILQIYDGENMQAWLRERGIKRWTRWDEAEIGPNAFSLGIKTKGGISLIGPENYLSVWKDVSFYFSPIFLGENELLGGLALMVPSSTHIKYAKSYTEAICRAIELQYLWFEMLIAATNVTEGFGFLTLDQSYGQNHILTMSDEIFAMIGLKKRESYYEQLESFFDSLPANPELWRIVNERREVSDKMISITCRGKRSSVCISTSRYEEEKFHISGLVIVFNSYSRIQKLASKYTTSVARFCFDNIIGTSPAFRETLQASLIAADSESNILLTGESGVGKDVIAQAIHNRSNRKNGPFVAVNCASFSKELISSELFGYEEGAFTGARRGGSIGKFELANGGTLFLDEIGDMPMDLQAVLLRVLEDRSFMKVGGNRTIDVNVRIIAATNKDLMEKMRNGLFREDLFYRLGIVRIHIPPLRQRGGDVFDLTDYFISSICARQDKPPVRLAESTKDFFLKYPWPGNVRELQNLLEGIISTQEASVIQLETVMRYLGYETPGAVFPSFNTWKEEPDQREQILRELKKHRNNRTKAAQALGMSRRTFYRRLKEYGIEI